MIKRLLKVCLAFALLLAVCAGAFVFDAWRWLNGAATPVPQGKVVVVRKGDSVSGLAQRLAREGLVDRPVTWSWYARLIEPAPIIAGEYLLGGSITAVELLRRLQSGKVAEYKLTFIEGGRFTDFLAVVAAHKKITHTLGGLSLEQKSKAIGIESAHPEGWLYPDTYSFQAGDLDTDILRRAHKKMVRELNRAWAGKAGDLPYASAYEALIMASIVEKETAVEFERADIAGVFVRRLKSGMRLQTDPTVIYGLGEDYQGNLTRTHLKTTTAYNTYRINGLPPTPIANPGTAALFAATHPRSGDYLYFVAKGDGTHQFSVTLDQHNKAVDEYQRRRRSKNYRSSPK